MSEPITGRKPRTDPGGGSSLRGGRPPRGAAGPAVAADADRGTLLQRLRVVLLTAVAWIASHLPEGLVIRVADLAGLVWYHSTPARAARARRHLARVAMVLAERGTGSTRARAAATDPKALERLVRAAYQHAARYYLEVIRTPRMTARWMRERVLIETPDVVDEAFESGGAVVFVGMHFGAIELPALYLARRSGRRVSGPMETVGNPALQRWFVRTRGALGVRILGLREARRELLVALRAGESIGIVGDRDINGGGVSIDLFGHPAPLPVGPALLAIESGAPVYLAAVRRDGPGRYRARVARIEVPTEGTRRERVEGTLRHLAAGFETAIADAPEQWWAVFHPIWPDLEDDPAGSAVER